MGGDHDGPVALAETGAAIEQYILFTQGGIRGEAQSRDVVSFLESGFVERLNIGKDVGVLVARGGQFMRGQGIKHEGVVRVGRMGQLDFTGLFFGLGSHLSCSHGRTASFYPGRFQAEKTTASRATLRSTEGEVEP